jgi:ATP-binding cassette subfamily F protein uup
MDDPNVLLLDEPTNDLDIETLNELEDLLDGWPGTLILVSHDRYFLERVSDKTVALLGDGKLSMLPGGVDEYLARRSSGAALSARAASGATSGTASATSATGTAPQEADSGLSAKDERELRKELSRLERQLSKLDGRQAKLHASMADAAADYGRLASLDAELKEILTEKDTIEGAWLELADRLGE